MTSTLAQHTWHPRQYEQNRFVYPVLSRRSRGISIGVNLNPDKVCNFDCIYCQVDRRSEAETRFVEMDRLLTELDGLLEFVTSCAIWSDPKFADVPAELRRLNDIAFSGDGEPTTFRNLDEIVTRVAEIKRARGLDEVKLVLITNASMFHRPAVERVAPDPGRQQRRNLGEAGSRDRRVLPDHRAHEDPVPAGAGQHHPGGPGAADRHPVAVHAGERRTAACRGDR
jgi:hypothetical protein